LDAGKAKIQVLADSALGESQLAGSKTVPSQGRGAEGTFLGLFTRALIPS